MSLTRPTQRGPRPTDGLLHQVFPYRGGEEFLGTALPFLEQGVHAGDVVVCITGPDSVERLRERLPGAVADEVHFAVASSWYSGPARALARTCHLIEEHAGQGRPVRLLGETLAHGGAAEVQRWLRYEVLINAALAGHPAWVLCPYDRSSLAEAPLAAVLLCHPQVTGGGRSWPSPDYQPPEAHYQDWIAPPLPEPPGSMAVEVVTASGLVAARREVTARARLLGLGADVVDDFVYAVSEVLSNAIEHAGGVATLRVWVEQRHLVCEVIDYGDGIRDRLPGYLPPSLLAGRGRGLWIARQMCEDVAIRTGPNGTTIRLRSPG
ncbi:MAG: anti-sigma factor RsbA family regulatory protein [Pseudonocardia sp.]